MFIVHEGVDRRFDAVNHFDLGAGTSKISAEKASFPVSNINPSSKQELNKWKMSSNRLKFFQHAISS